MANDGHSIRFIENQGQWQPEILFKADISSGHLLITRKGLRYVFYDAQKLANLHLGNNIGDSVKARLSDPGDYMNSRKINMHSVGMYFKGLSPGMKINPMNESKTYYNYFLGNDPAKWATRVKAYSEIVYQDVYEGIDMKLYSRNGHVKYDLIVKQGADASQIEMVYEGADFIRNEYNSLYIETSLGSIIENAPYVYQIDDADTLTVASRFILEGNRFAYEFPDGFDQTKELVIDPVLVFSTYSGSTYDNWGNTATFDDLGNVYSGGTVRQEYGYDFPVTDQAFQQDLGGGWDLGILKFDSTGSDLIYGTYLGGSDTETPFSLIVDKNDNLLILGITGSSNLPVTGNAYSNEFKGGPAVTNAIGNYNNGYFGVAYLNGSDFFIAKINATGDSLLASTYFGGTNNDGINNFSGMPLSRNYGDEFRGEINIDDHNNVFIACNTSSDDIDIIDGFQPVYGGGPQDGIIAKFSPDLDQLVWSTFLGGANADAAYGIRIRDSGHVYITGGTLSDDFPVSASSYKSDHSGDIDAFVSRISADGDSLISGTFLGTADYDQAYFIDLDTFGNVYVLGQTKGQYPVSAEVYTNPLSGQFIHKLNAGLDQSIFSTVVGSGSFIPDISPTAFLVNECGNIYLSGWGGGINRYVSHYNGGNTIGMPISNDAFQKNTDGNDFYLMVLSSNAKRFLFGTYLGSINTGPGEHVDGGTSRFDKRGIVYHAICACRDDSQFPTTPGVWSNTNNSLQGCNNGVFKFDLASLKADFTTDTWEFDKRGIVLGCRPFEVVFLNRSISGEVFEWDFGDGSEKVVKDDSLFHTYENIGDYSVTLKAVDENTCISIDYETEKLTVVEPEFYVPADETICQYTEVKLEASGAIQYEWSPPEGLTSTIVADPIASPDSTTTYYLSMMDKNECELYDSVEVKVIPKITTDFIANYKYNCLTPPSIELINRSVNATDLIWDFGDQNSSTEDSLLYTFEKPGAYNIRLTASNDGLCDEQKTVGVSISDIFIPNVITPNGDKKNDSFQVLTDARVNLIITNRWGKTLFQADDYQNDWPGTDYKPGVYYYDVILNNDVSCRGWIHLLK